MEYAYATCILNESGEEINEKNLTAVLEAAGCEVHESRVKALVAALEDVEIDSAVDVDESESDSANGGESTTEGSSEPAESDLTEASGIDLVSGEAGGEFDGSDETGTDVDADAGAPAERGDDSGGSPAAPGDGDTASETSPVEDEPGAGPDEV